LERNEAPKNRKEPLAKIKNFRTIFKMMERLIGEIE
jgi:hypothetical protein